MYAKFFKRPLDLFLSLTVLVILSPLILIIIVISTIMMKGNPFFIQIRPGRNEKLFKMIKFRTMTNEKDLNGELLPDDIRLTKYGKFLRKTSIDELLELINIIKGDMSLIGPRPLCEKYLPYYTEEEQKRHTVRPGLTGLAQVRGRNILKWEERFAYDLEYINTLSFFNDIKLIFITIQTVVSRKNITVRSADVLMDFDEYRRMQLEQLELGDKNEYFREKDSVAGN